MADYVVAAVNLPLVWFWFGFGIAQTLRLYISSVGIKSGVEGTSKVTCQAAVTFVRAMRSADKLLLPLQSVVDGLPSQHRDRNEARLYQAWG